MRSRSRHPVAEQVPDAIATRRMIAEGRIYREILSAAKPVEADLIVMGSHRPELRDDLLGPSAARVVRHAACSVLVVRERRRAAQPSPRRRRAPS